MASNSAAVKTAEKPRFSRRSGGGRVFQEPNWARVIQVGAIPDVVYGAMV